MLSRALLAAALALPLPALAQHADPEVASGYVTALSSPISFSLEGTPVHLAPAVTYARQTGAAIITTEAPPLYLGEFLRISGHWDKPSRFLLASRILVVAPTLSPVSGTAIIDLIPPSTNPSAADRTIRADGFLLHLTPGTILTIAPPLLAGAALATNLWIDYHGTRQIDGSVLVDRANLRKNLVNHTEGQLRQNSEFDPAAVTPEDRQGAFSKHFRGLDPKRIPAVANPQLQARIDRIGTSLIPAYQRSLDPADPTRIHFRFQLVDLPREPRTITLPSGIILVPTQFLDRLANDSQIAALLAQSIADALEKDDLRLQPTKNARSAASLAAVGAEFFVPGTSLATSLTGAGVQARVQTLQREQRNRVSLCLLDDAGYDLREAPLALWILASEKSSHPGLAPLPSEAAYLYQVLGTNFRHPTAAIQPAQP